MEKNIFRVFIMYKMCWSFFAFFKLRNWSIDKTNIAQTFSHRYRVLYTAVFKLACLKGKCLQWERATFFASVGLCAFKVNFLNVWHETWDNWKWSIGNLKIREVLRMIHIYSALIKTLLVWDKWFMQGSVAILILDLWLHVFNNRLMLLSQYIINKTCLG